MKLSENFVCLFFQTHDENSALKICVFMVVKYSFLVVDVFCNMALVRDGPRVCSMPCRHWSLKKHDKQQSAAQKCMLQKPNLRKTRQENQKKQ